MIQGGSIGVASPGDDLWRVEGEVLGPVYRADCGQHGLARLVLIEGLSYCRDGVGMVLRKDETGAGGSEKLRIYC